MYPYSMKRKDTKMQKMTLPGGWDTDYIPPTPNRKAKRMKKRNFVAVISGIVLLSAVLTAVASVVFFKLNPTLASNALYHSSQNYHSQSMDRNNGPVTTINGLNRISVVGSTAFIVDGHRRTISADPNPYGVAIAPSGVPASTTP